MPRISATVSSGDIIPNSEKLSMVSLELQNPLVILVYVD